MLHVPLVPLSLGTTSPFLSTSSAHLIASCFAISYVGSLYVSKNGRLSFWSKAGHARSKMGEQRFRDDPVVIKSRLLAVCISTLLSCLTVSWLVWKSGERVRDIYRSLLSRLSFYDRAPVPPWKLLYYDWVSVYLVSSRFTRIWWRQPCTWVRFMRPTFTVIYPFKLDGL